MSVSHTSASNRSPKLSASAIAATRISRSSGSGPERASLGVTLRLGRGGAAAASSATSEAATSATRVFVGDNAIPTCESCAQRLCLPATPITTTRAWMPAGCATQEQLPSRRVQGPVSQVHWPEALEKLENVVDGRHGNTRRKGIYLLPNLVTTGGLFAGFYSIVASIDGNFHAGRVGDLRRDAARRPRRPCRASHEHGERVRQGVRQPRRHGFVRVGARHRRLSMGRRAARRVWRHMGPARLARGVPVRRGGGVSAWRASTATSRRTGGSSRASRARRPPPVSRR